MQQNAFGNQQAESARGGGIRWWVILLFAGYAAWQWLGTGPVYWRESPLRS